MNKQERLYKENDLPSRTTRRIVDKKYSLFLVTLTFPLGFLDVAVTAFHSQNSLRDLHCCEKVLKSRATKTVTFALRTNSHDFLNVPHNKC